MASDHTAHPPHSDVSDVSGKHVNIDMPLVDNAEPVKSASNVTAQSTSLTAETETNGTCPEQLEMMIVKDGIPHVRDTKGIQDVLSLGCNCRQRSTFKGDVVMMTMLLSNMLNYMDRFTIVGMLKFV